MKKPIIFSGIQPTNNIHLGNYLGAIRNWTQIQNDYQCIFSIVNLHAITVYQKPEDLAKNTLNVAKTYLALGLDPKKNIIFTQSDVPAHTELAWMLNTIAKMGEMNRMTQFKDKTGIDFEELESGMSELLGVNIQNQLSSKLNETFCKENYSKEILINITKGVASYAIEFVLEKYKTIKNNFNSTSVGLFDYPVLMAADILLYNTQVVPVGADQKQHVELCRNLAERFNHLYGETFVVPEPLIKEQGARIMGLDDSSKKMSKSAASSANYIALLDDPEVARKKIMRAVTDSGSEIKSGNDKPALTNLLTIYSLLSNCSISELEKKYTGRGYGDFKKDLAEVVVKFLTDFQTRFYKIKDSEVKKVLADGAKRANKIAGAKLMEVRKKMGIV